MKFSVKIRTDPELLTDLKGMAMIVTPSPIKSIIQSLTQQFNFHEGKNPSIDINVEKVELEGMGEWYYHVWGDDILPQVVDKLDQIDGVTARILGENSRITIDTSLRDIANSLIDMSPQDILTKLSELVKVITQYIHDLRMEK